MPRLDPAELFAHVYARPTAALEHQRAALLARAARTPRNDRHAVAEPETSHRQQAARPPAP